MSIAEIKRNDWMRKNNIMGLSFALAAGIGLVVQIILRMGILTILSIAIPFVFACIFFALRKKVEAISKTIPYILLVSMFAITLSIIFEEANLSTVGLVFLTLILGSIHGQVRIVVFAYVLSLIALLLNNHYFVNSEIIAGSGANVLLLHFL